MPKKPLLKKRFSTPHRTPKKLLTSFSQCIGNKFSTNLIGSSNHQEPRRKALTNWRPKAAPTHANIKYLKTCPTTQTNTKQERREADREGQRLDLLEQCPHGFKPLFDFQLPRMKLGLLGCVMQVLAWRLRPSAEPANVFKRHVVSRANQWLS